MRTKKRVKKYVCKMCGAAGSTEIHHIYSGAYRKLSDDNDFVIELCHICHRHLHDNGKAMRKLKEDTQREFEAKYSHEEFIRRMKNSWL